MTPPEAAEFLVARIAEQAISDGTPLDAYEQQALRCPDSIELALVFQEHLDSEAFDQKFALLVSRASESLSGPHRHKWNQAVQVLETTDQFCVLQELLLASKGAVNWRRVWRIAGLAVLLSIAITWALRLYARLTIG